MSYVTLLGIADGDLAGALRAQLGELSDMQVSGIEVSSGDVVGALADTGGVDVVLIHEDLGPLPALDLVREICLRYPHLGVVLMVEEGTPAVFTAAMEAGARGVLTIQPSLEELQGRLATAAEWSRSMRRHLDASFSGPLPGHGGTLLALAGAKGGTGTTTLAVHLALAVSAARRTVCLVDLDLQSGDIPSYLDLTHRRSIVDLVDVADDLNPTVLADTLFVHPSGPHVLLAPQEGERGEDVTARAARQILGNLRSRYDVVIADCGSHMTEAGAMAVEMADRVALTVTPDLPCLRAAKRLTKLWSRLQVRKEDDLSVTLTRQSKRNEVQPDFARKVLGVPLLRPTVPAAFRSLETAANVGSPTSVDDDGFKRTIGALARELGAITPATSTTQATPATPATPSVTRRKRGAKNGGDSGQATIETVGLAPFIVLIVLVIWQSVLIGMGALSASHAANEAARAAAVTSDVSEIRKRGQERVPAPWGQRVKIRYVPGDEHPSGNPHVLVTVGTPVVLPGVFYAPWPIQAQSRVVKEG